MSERRPAIIAISDQRIGALSWRSESRPYARTHIYFFGIAFSSV